MARVDAAIAAFTSRNCPIWTEQRGACSSELRPLRPQVETLEILISRPSWRYDFVQGRTHDGRAFRTLTVIDEFTRECLAIEVARRLRSDDVLYILTELFTQHGVPDHIRSDNGSESTVHPSREATSRNASSEARFARTALPRQ